MSVEDSGLKKHIPIPVDILGEEGMSLNLFASICAKTLRGVALQKTGHDAPSLGWHVGREVEGVGKDALVHCIYVFIIEWWKAGLMFQSALTSEPL